MKSRIEAEPINLGFQMAPMIDIIFVIMLFYMVRAGELKMERQLNMTLPSQQRETTVTTPAEQPFEELLLMVDEEGFVFLNDQEVGAADDVKLESLASLLTNIRQNASDGGVKVLATLQTEDATHYQRVMDVMNALARAKISNLTFTVSEEAN